MSLTEGRLVYIEVGDEEPLVDIIQDFYVRHLCFPILVVKDVNHPLLKLVQQQIGLEIKYVLIFLQQKEKFVC